VTAPGAGGLIISYILGAIPLMTVSWLASHWRAPGADLIITLIGMTIGAGLAYAVWKLAAERYMTIK
jgi:hypothetical protein